VKRYTVDDILELNPCSPYTRRKIRKLWGKRKSLALVSIMKLNIPVEDKLWVACRLLDRRTSVSWACDCVERTLPIFEKELPEDKRPRNAIEVTRAWVAGKATLGEVRVTVDAAHDAAYATYATYATFAATYAAHAASFVFAAAEAASFAAAHAAANFAVSNATERTWQFNRMLEYVRNG